MSNLEAAQVIPHFSHQHPLELLNFQPHQSTQTLTCSACKRIASGWLYCCSACNYFLHKPCSKMPQTLVHAVDEKHKLTLLSSPAYPEGAFVCNACGSPGTGFSYHCKDCQIDVHTICAFMPLSIKHSAHNHTLSLCFSPPYDCKAFDCDICKGSGSDHWLYRCDSCEFDVHMKCAKAKTQAKPISAATQQRQQQSQLGKSKSVPPQIPKPSIDFSPPQVPLDQQHMGFGFSNGTQTYVPQVLNRYLTAPILLPQQVQPQKTNSVVNEVIGSAIKGISGAITQEVVQALVQGALGS